MYRKVDELCEGRGSFILIVSFCMLLLKHYSLLTVIKCKFFLCRTPLGVVCRGEACNMA